MAAVAWQPTIDPTGQADLGTVVMMRALVVRRPRRGYRGGPAGRRRAEPQRRLGRLHGLVDHGQQLAPEGVQVDLVAEAGREPLHGPGGVIAAAVEAPVDQVLDPPAQR